MRAFRVVTMRSIDPPVLHPFLCPNLVSIARQVFEQRLQLGQAYLGGVHWMRYVRLVRHEPRSLRAVDHAGASATHFATQPGASSPQRAATIPESRLSPEEASRPPSECSSSRFRTAARRA